MQTKSVIRVVLTLLVAQITVYRYTDGAPDGPVSASTLSRTSDINAEAIKQKILLPVMSSKVQLYSQFGKGFLFVNPKRNQYSPIQIQTKSQNSNQHTFLWRARTTDAGKAKLVTFITNAGLKRYRGDSPLHPNGNLQRLVRVGDRLVAKNSGIEKAAYFLVKRFPTICNETADISPVKPLQVQLMLIDTESEFHQSLLQLEYNTKYQLTAKFVKSDGFECPPRGYNVAVPSVHPGTLFTMLYGPSVQ